MATRAERSGGLSRDFLVLLPPSEGKALGGSPKPWASDQGVFGSALDGSRRQIISGLTALAGGTPTMLGVKGPHLDRAQGANLTLIGAATLPAWQRYTGVVWDHLDPASLTAPQRARLVVVSGLGGLFAAEDPVPDYRLKMGASMAGIGPVAKFWRAPIGAALAQIPSRTVLVDLLALEQRAGLPPNLPRLEVTIRTRAGALGGHAAKAAKGDLARYLATLAGRVSTAGLTVAITSWEHPDFCAEISSQ